MLCRPLIELSLSRRAVPGLREYGEQVFNGFRVIAQTERGLQELLRLLIILQPVVDPAERIEDIGVPWLQRIGLFHKTECFPQLHIPLGEDVAERVVAGGGIGAERDVLP